MMVLWGSYPQNQLISAWQLTKIHADSPNSPKALWHDAELKLLAWGMLNALFMATWLVPRHALPCVATSDLLKSHQVGESLGGFLWKSKAHCAFCWRIPSKSCGVVNLVCKS